MNYSKKNFANLTSGAIGFLAPSYFAYKIYQEQLPQNIATWILFLTLDVLGLILSIRAGNKKPFMQIGWVASSLCIVLAIILQKTSWNWGTVETLSSISASITILYWTRKGATNALPLYILTAYISATPQAVEYFYSPQPETWIPWGWSIVSCALSVYGAEKKDSAHILIPSSLGILNLLMLFLVLR